MSEQDFDGKVCFVTGGTQGVGEAVALHFARHGAPGVVLCGSSRDRGARVRAAIENLGVVALFVPVQLESESECTEVIAAAADRFARIDVLVNAGATTKRGSITDTSATDIDEVFATNVHGPMVLMREAIAVMRREGSGAAS